MFATKSFHKGPDRLENELFYADIDQAQLLIHQVAPPGDPGPDRCGVETHRNKLLVWIATLNFSKYSFHPGSFHGDDDDQEGRAELLPSPPLMWRSSGSNPCMSHPSRSFAIS